MFKHYVLKISGSDQTAKYVLYSFSYVSHKEKSMVPCSAKYVHDIDTSEKADCSTGWPKKQDNFWALVNFMMVS